MDNLEMNEELKKLIKKEFKTIVLDREVIYPQLTYSECLKFEVGTQLKGDKITEWVFIFINKYLVQKNLDEKKLITKEEFTTLDVLGIWTLLKRTAFKTYFGDENQKKDRLKELGEKKKQGSGAPYASWIMSLVESFKLDPKTLLNRYTPEQLSEYTKGYIFNRNEETKEGQDINRINSLKRNSGTLDKSSDEFGLSDLEILNLREAKAKKRKAKNKK